MRAAVPDFNKHHRSFRNRGDTILENPAAGVDEQPISILSYRTALKRPKVRPLPRASLATRKQPKVLGQLPTTGNWGWIFLLVVRYLNSVGTTHVHVLSKLLPFMARKC